jgi:hypothetical protein
MQGMPFTQLSLILKMLLHDPVLQHMIWWRCSIPDVSQAPDRSAVVYAYLLCRRQSAPQEAITSRGEVSGGLLGQRNSMARAHTQEPNPAALS